MIEVVFVGQMPPEMVNELWVKVGQLYPKWGPSDPNDWTEETTEKAVTPRAR